MLEAVHLPLQMSDEQLKAFLDAVKADAGLQEKLKSATDADAVVAIANAAGFVVSADSLKKAQVELSEEELEGVAGGQKYKVLVGGRSWKVTANKDVAGRC